MAHANIRNGAHTFRTGYASDGEGQGFEDLIEEALGLLAAIAGTVLHCIHFSRRIMLVVRAR